MVVTNIT